jgi:hypothetical protein
LAFKVDFCLKHHDEIFVGNVRRSLEQWKKQKDLVDLVIHGKWANATVPMLEHTAGIVRPFIQNIFDRTALRAK